MSIVKLAACVTCTCSELNNNQLSTIDITWTSGLDNLQMLNLSSNVISTIQPGALAAMPRLEILLVSATP
jgi:Leucine-rich repeat (LRR) protein